MADRQPARDRARDLFDRGRPLGVVSVVTWGFRIFRWLAERDRRATVVVEEIQPGESIMITHRRAEPSPRKQRRQTRKSVRTARKEAEQSARARVAKVVDDITSDRDRLKDQLESAQAGLRQLRKDAKSRVRDAQRDAKQTLRSEVEETVTAAKASRRAIKRRALRKAAKLEKKAAKLEKKAARAGRRARRKLRKVTADGDT